MRFDLYILRRRDKVRCNGGRYVFPQSLNHFKFFVLNNEYIDRAPTARSVDSPKISALLGVSLAGVLELDAKTETHASDVVK